MSQQVSFRNRHGERILMTYDGKETITMVGGEFFNLLDFARTSTDNDGEVIMFDPPGGPCIYGMAYWDPAVDRKTSMNLKSIDPLFTNLFVDKIIINEVGESVKIKVKQADENGNIITSKLRIKESGTEEGS
jgi:hypothetical protein